MKKNHQFQSSIEKDAHRKKLISFFLSHDVPRIQPIVIGLHVRDGTGVTFCDPATQ